MQPSHGGGARIAEGDRGAALARPLCAESAIHRRLDTPSIGRTPLPMTGAFLPVAQDVDDEARGFHPGVGRLINSIGDRGVSALKEFPDSMALPTTIHAPLARAGRESAINPLPPTGWSAVLGPWAENGATTGGGRAPWHGSCASFLKHGESGRCIPARPTALRLRSQALPTRGSTLRWVAAGKNIREVWRRDGPDGRAGAKGPGLLEERQLTMMPDPASFSSRRQGDRIGRAPGPGEPSARPAHRARALAR